ncbi:hypothetical protein AKJ09_06242 [Labilithrix luteola]|uniref:Transmembrane protein n=1 Tax=Labilithrix luteola TaxID=1391654 RepID=A0A0K1Q1C4_9BACT|nr:DUF4870 domain-containing protein [Labilithrix luteola]AKU99578.1 hypothetical protein AKJ09_06242 [Labilithrix luteola]
MNTSLPVVQSSVSHNERVAAAVAHAGTCVAWFLAPLLVWFAEKDHSPFVEHQAMQALLWSALGTLVSLATCGLAIPVFLGFHVYAAIRVLSGDDYEYPLVSELARRLSKR